MHDLTTAHRYAITLEAASARGQVAAITALLEQHGAYIEELSVFDDELSQRFYLRCVFRVDMHASHAFDLANMRNGWAVSNRPKA